MEQVCTAGSGGLLAKAQTLKVSHSCSSHIAASDFLVSCTDTLFQKAHLAFIQNGIVLFERTIADCTRESMVRSAFFKGEDAHVFL